MNEIEIKYNIQIENKEKLNEIYETLEKNSIDDFKIFLDKQEISIKSNLQTTKIIELFSNINIKAFLFF
jgi:hypothetical protein